MFDSWIPRSQVGANPKPLIGGVTEQNRIKNIKKDSEEWDSYDEVGKDLRNELL